MKALFTMAFRHVLKHGTPEERDIVLSCEARGDIIMLSGILREIRKARLAEVK